MSEINQVDLSAMQEKLPVKKGRGRPKGSGKKAVGKSAPIDLDSEEREMKELKEKLLQFADHNPAVVEKPINDRIAKLVDNMSIDELRARCRQGKKICSGRMDSVVGEQLIYLANQTCGTLLECVDELQASTEKDKLLHETTTEYFSLHLLDFVPEEVKIMGIYSSHVLKAYYQAQMKAPVAQQKPVVKLPEPVVLNADAEPFVITKKEEPKPDLIKLSRKDTQVVIPAVQETRDKLIRMREDLKNLTNH